RAWGIDLVPILLGSHRQRRCVPCSFASPRRYAPRRWVPAAPREATGAGNTIVRARPAGKPRRDGPAPASRKPVEPLRTLERLRVDHFDPFPQGLVLEAAVDRQPEPAADAVEQIAAEQR